MAVCVLAWQTYCIRDCQLARRTATNAMRDELNSLPQRRMSYMGGRIFDLWFMFSSGALNGTSSLQTWLMAIQWSPGRQSFIFDSIYASKILMKYDESYCLSRQLCVIRNIHYVVYMIWQCNVPLCIYIYICIYIHIYKPFGKGNCSAKLGHIYPKLV